MRVSHAGAAANGGPKFASGFGPVRVTTGVQGPMAGGGGVAGECTNYMLFCYQEPRLFGSPGR